MVEGFGVRLSERIRALGPLCVGIDPSPHVLSSWGREDSAEDLEYCARAALAAVEGVAAVVKAQVSYFERFGSVGYRALERLISDAREADVIFIADAKRADIGSTNEGYASAWLDPQSPLGVDALTVNPYLGVGALEPLFDLATRNARGVFVVAATSNDEGRAIQSARLMGGEMVQDFVLRQIAERNEINDARGSVGAVVGATRDRPDFDLGLLGGPVLVPGVGFQGATSDDVARLCQRCAPASVLVNVGRALLAAGPDRRSLRDSAQRWRDELSAALV